MEQKTIIRTNNPDRTDEYMTLVVLHDVSYPITSNTRLLIDGELYMALRSEVDIVTRGEGSIVTTITAIADDGS